MDFSDQPNKNSSMLLKKVTLLLLTTFSFVMANAQIDARLFRYPDVSQTQITFTYGGDVWIAPIEGGKATKLSSPAGNEISPKFSPKGDMIAFSGNYDGNFDIYVIPSEGGVPRRVTHHGMPDRIQDWYPDGENLLFTSSMHSGKQRFSQFYKTTRKGGLPEKLPMAYGEFGSFNSDATKIAFTDKSRVFRNWKRYKGGMAADIFIFDLETMESENITNHEANDEMPMWHGNRIYYLSDKGVENRYNIWYYDLSTREHHQATSFSDFDVHMPSLGPGHLVFQAGGDIHLLDLKTLESKIVKIIVTSDMVSVKPHNVDASKFIANMTLSHDGKRALVEARGELFSLPASKGVVQNLTRSSGSAERYPAWSPNGRHIAYWSDKTGEYELTIRDASTGKERTITKLGPGYRYNLYWSPDSKHLVFADQSMAIMLANVETGATKEIDRDLNLFEYALRNFKVTWSSDSKWVGYDRALENGNSAIFLHEVDKGISHQVTSGFYADYIGDFDPDGEYLYILSNRSFKPVYSDFDNSFVYPNATGIGAISLRDDVMSPLAPKNDTVSIVVEEESEDSDEESSEEDDEEVKDDEEEKLVIDLKDFERRLVMLPVDPGNLGPVSAVSGKVVYLRFPNNGSGESSSGIKIYDVKEQEEKTVISGVRGYEISADGKKMLVIKGRSAAGIVNVAPDQKLEDMIPLAQMSMTVDPREEWEQIFTDAWRFERDFFYDQGMHGVNWSALRGQYGDLIQYAITRDDVNFIIGELIGELNASHTYKGGGDEESGEQRAVGYLGVDWEMHEGMYRVKDIVRGADWDNEVRSPLDAPGVDIDKGDYILAVNGVALTEFTDPWGAFEGLSGQTVELLVNDKPTFDGAQTKLAKTMGSETRLRNLAWIEQNRKKVDEMSDGKIGYIYVPSTGVDGQTELVRQFYAQWNKEGLIIDERFNNGGQIPDRFIELLNRKPLAYWSVRDGQNWQWPPVAHFGSMAMLANGWSGSGGDAFPDYFQKAGLGPVIGTRTWGGLIGISGSPTLVDGGSVTVPTFRMYNPDGTWFKEGYGVDPDIEVKEDPTQLAKGNDTQLLEAIEYVKKQVEKKGPIHPKEPGKEKRT